MNDIAEAIPASVRIERADPLAPILKCTGRQELAIKAGTAIEISGQTHSFEAETAIVLGELRAGHDYAVTVGADGKPYAVDASEANPLQAEFPAGFHFALGGNASARSGGDDIPAINAFSLWDIGFRPACPDPRGMALIEMKEGRRFWADIYLLGASHKEAGTSRFGVEIADGRSLDRLDYATAAKIMGDHGKRLMIYDEFHTAAFGITERSSAPRDPKSTGLDAARTSRFGLMQATGNLWVWGIDGDPDEPRPSIFGGSWFVGSDAGSRCAHLDCWPGLSLGSISARGACDHL